MTRHITTEHSGSSIPIVTTTNALTNKLNIIWQQLKSKANHWVFGYKSRSMTTEAELFLSMCSMYPDDFRIPIEDLVIYGMGLELFEDVRDMSAARCRVLDIISIINDQKHPHKALGGKIRLAHEKDGPRDQYVKMLVGARDLAKSIALSYPLVFHRDFVIEKWTGISSYKDCYGLSLELKKINEYPINLECPKIALLQLQYREDSQTVPIKLFEGMKELRVLSLDVPLLPQSLNVLRNLRTLRLKVPKLEDMSSIGDLLNLEFLSISALCLTEIPRELGQLENLRLLDLRKINIAYIPPGVLSRLLRLEELYLPFNYVSWGCKAKYYDDYDEWELGERDNYDDQERINANISEIDDEERINASLSEVVSLSLNALQICVPKASILPKKCPIFKNIQEFKFLMPSNVKYQPFGKYSMNVLQLTSEASEIKESGICDLFSRAEDLSLTGVQNLKNVIYQLVDNGFPQLKKMIISECDELEYLVDTTNRQILSEGDFLFRKLECLHLSMLSNLKEICHGRWTNLRWFLNLSQISIRFCPKLKYVFPQSILRGLILKSIEILDCNQMEGIFYEDEENNIPLTLCSIEKLDLHSLPRLIGLLVQNDNTIDGVHNDINQSLATNKIVSSYTEESIITFAKDSKSSLTNESTPTTSSRANEQKDVTQQQVSIVKNKDVSSHMKMYSVFSSTLAVKWFRNLKSLKIAFCDLVKVVFLFEENHATSKAFNSLEVLELYGLRNLVHIWFWIPPRITGFKNLQLLVLSECCSSYVFSYRVAKLFVQLQKIYVSRCEKMEEIIVKDDENDRKDRIVLPRLKLLELQHIPNLRILFGVTNEIELPLLESLKLKQCNKMKSFSYGLMRMPMLEGIEVNGSFQLLRKDLNVIIKGIIDSSASVTIPHTFTFADLKIATKDFSSENFLEGGGFGKVYKGWIDKKTFRPSKTSIGMPVAIKRMNPESKQGIREWKSEVDILGSKLHQNLVKLLGHCSKDGELLLVYEFIPRGSLYDYLLTRNLGIKPLSWDMRIKIAIGVARGLNFLHTSEKKVIHRDIKPGNILLDKDYNAKIADFGLALWGPSDGDSHVTTMDYKSKIVDFGLALWGPSDGNSKVTTMNFNAKRSDFGSVKISEVSTLVKGTWGYLDPAYARSNHVSVKSDVYSFGVVLLELMTGLKALDKKRPEKQRNLVLWLKPILSQKRELKDIMDSTMEGQYSSKAMLLIGGLASKCTEDDPRARPTMGEVLKKLQQIDAIKEKHKH